MAASTDTSAIEKKLTPAPSLSRTGKMTHSAMHTDALVRGGVAALQSKVRKKGKNTITLAEIIDPSQLDSFGTALPGTDAGRGKELCSSPRGHPELQNKLEEILMKDRASHFKAKMELKEEHITPIRASPLKTKRAIQPPVVKQKVKVAKTNNQSACFLTVDRFLEKKHETRTPPVGHYRPKFSAIDGNSKAMMMRVPTVQVGTPREQEESTPCCRLLRTENLMEAKEAATQSKHIEPSPPPAEDERSPQRCMGYAEWIAKRKKGAPTKGSSAFVSNVKNTANRPTPTTTSPDKFYYPYNEMGMGKREGNMCLEWGRYTSRQHKIMFKGYSPNTDAPDAVYDPEKPGVHTSASYRFDNQIARGKAAADAQQMVSRRNNCINAASTGDTQKFPASHIVYETGHGDKIKYKANGNLTDFARTIARDQKPTEVQKPRQPLDPVTPYDVSLAEKPPGRVTFESQLERPEFLSQVPHDLEYDVRNPAAKTSPSADIDRTGGHDVLFVPSITMDCDYNPNYAAVKPQSQFDVHLDKVLSRDEIRAGHCIPQPLDTFYSTDPCMQMSVGGSVVKVPLKGSRIMGNPMIHSHISREKRQISTAVKKCSPDKYYNIPQSDCVPTIDFKRTVAREERSCGRMLPASPKQECSRQRSPGFVYNPELVQKHIPALSFSRAGFV